VSWQSALRKVTEQLLPEFRRPTYTLKEVDYDRLVTIDFETYFDIDYTLSKLSTSEYVRDSRFKAQMMYLKVGKKPARIIPPNKIRAELRKINWATHAVLCHHTQFDGLILSHHYQVKPSFYYDTLSMARGLHSNEIGAGLDEVSVYYGGKGKLHDILDKTKGVLNWSPQLFAEVSTYCMNDGDETLRIFNEMIWELPEKEVDLIDLIVRMFCDPVLCINIPRVEKELARELAERDALLKSIVDLAPYKADEALYKKILPKTAERNLPPAEHDMLMVKRIIGSNERFAGLLLDEEVDPPVKLSPAWMKRTREEREATPDDKWVYAFAKDDLEFVNLPDDQTRWQVSYDLDDLDQVAMLAAKQIRLRALVDARIAVKSTTNITRAERLLVSGKDGMCLPAYYAYSRAHTHRLGGGDKRNLQNLQRGGELRQSIEAPKGHALVVGDSGQIEARVNAYLWGQEDLLAGWRLAKPTDITDAYTRFATKIYSREITKADKTERFVGKVCILGLGFQMGAPKLQMTLAKGALGGPPIFFTLEQCQKIVSTYRAANNKIEKGWGICSKIIEDMAAGRTGAHGPISWEQDCIWLPNGMRLHYPGLKLAKNPDKGWDEWTYQGTLKGVPIRKKIYGGLLCENIVQALARIIVMYQMLDLSKSMRMVLTTHDEMVACVKLPKADWAYERMMNRMVQPLDWCMDIPLASEGGHATNYSK
jgi:DNA polymerase I-like protein with 3'-5' exonuclease and polymerase domains